MAVWEDLSSCTGVNANIFKKQRLERLAFLLVIYTKQSSEKRLKY